MASFFTAAALAAIFPFTLATSDSCTNDASQLSCSGTSSDSCCINSPGGLFQQVQFWDTNPATGPSDSWTIHGLWPNNCDGTYNENCDRSRAYNDIGTLLKNAGQSATFDFMQTYWIPNNEANEKFWDHEWLAHGTCISTLNPGCYSNYNTGDEAVDFFNTTVSLFQTLPTYTWLANAGITPSNDQTYALADMENALAAAFGAPVVLLCQNSNVVYEIYYAFNVQGSLAGGQGSFVPTSNVNSNSNCPDTVQYLIKQ